VSTLSAAWIGRYARRATRMSPAERPGAPDQAMRAAWSRRQVREDIPAIVSMPVGKRRFTGVLPPDTTGQVPETAKAAVPVAADRLVKGEWEVLSVVRTDLMMPDWFWDPITGRRSSPDRYAFRINHRSEEQAGNVKNVWEISRLQHLTLLATAWFVSGDDAYARWVADQLRSWWRENPFLSGIHWTSGIEVGVRLISLAWIRRLLDDRSGVTGLFELDGQSQSGDGGPFLWLRHANGHEIDVADDGGIAIWIAEQDGYLSLQPPAHHRTVEIVDEIDGDSHDLPLAFHLGPDVQTELTGSAAFLCWPGVSAPGSARLALPRQLRWSLHRGETDPILGWYSCGLGRLTPACALIGRGRSAPHAAFVTRLHFADSWPEQARLAKNSGTEVPAVPSTST